jgi:hypothetical protein
MDGYKKDLGHGEIGQSAQKTLTIPSLLVNTRERVYTIIEKEKESSLQPRVTSSSQLWFKNLKRNVL